VRSRSCARCGAEQQQERELLGDRYGDHGLIFCTRDGRPLHGHDVVSRFYKPLLVAAGLPSVPMKNPAAQPPQPPPARGCPRCGGPAARRPCQRPHHPRCLREGESG
jgi:hypothetical protein